MHPNVQEIVYKCMACVAHDAEDGKVDIRDAVRRTADVVPDEVKAVAAALPIEQVVEFVKQHSRRNLN